MKVTCLKCDKVIGEIEIDDNQRVSYTQLWGILSSRLRIDGNWGFQCLCGNNSLLCPAEQGIVKGARPSSSDMKQIHERMKTKSQALVSRIGSTVTIDLFKIEGVNGEI